MPSISTQAASDSDRLGGFSNQPSLYQPRVWLLIAICFVLPMRVSYVYVLSALLLAAWVFEGNWRQKIEEVCNSRLCVAFLSYYIMFIIGLLWTDNMAAGLKMVGRQTPFLLFILYWSCAEPRFRERYVTAFVLGTAFCALLTHYNLIQINLFNNWPVGIRVSKSHDDTAPFIDRIMYSPMLATGAYFALRNAFNSSGSSARILFIGAAILCISNLLFSGGRAGMLMLVAFCVVFFLEKVKSTGKAFLFSFLIISVFSLFAYKSVDYLAQRVDQGLIDIKTFDDDPNTSLGQRMVYWTTTFRMVTEHPLLGVGSGDFKEEYKLIKPEKWKSTPDSFNPHNQFLMTSATIGLLGLSLLIAIFYYAARLRYDGRTLAILAGFTVICLFESYLWRSNTSFLFSVMLAVLTDKTHGLAKT